MSIEEDVKRCEQLTRSEHASWIGLSNQKAITGVLARIKELEESNRIYALNGSNIKLELHIKENYIPLHKVKDLKESIVLRPTIVGGRRNAKTLEYGIKLGKIKACEELLEEK